MSYLRSEHLRYELLWNSKCCPKDKMEVIANALADVPMRDIGGCIYYKMKAFFTDVVILESDGIINS